MQLIFKKTKRRLWSKVVRSSRNYSWYFWIYKSNWNVKFNPNLKGSDVPLYYAAIPNPGAGIGHQMANWIAGYWFAKQFKLQFCHIPFSSANWEQFLGFGEDEINLQTLLRNGYKKVLLPLFDENNPIETALQKNIIESYRNKKVVFVAEQDQGYKNQFGVMEDIKRKFYGAASRNKDQLQFSKDCFNIAIHLRRGDIVIGQDNQNPNLLLRWQDNQYFEKVLAHVVENVKTDKPLAIYLFSQGVKKDFKEFEQFSNLHYCLDWSAQDSFLHMVAADLLITSKSSFSYKPALLSNGIKVCPQNFWHGYPEGKDWVLVDKNGCFNSI